MLSRMTLALRIERGRCKTHLRITPCRVCRRDASELGELSWEGVTDVSSRRGNPAWPCGRWGHSLVVIDGGSVVVYGGESQDETCSDIQLLDTRTWQWQCIKCTGDSPERRFGHSCVYYGGNVIIFGGSKGAGYYDDLCCREDPSTMQSCTSSSSSSSFSFNPAPSPQSPPPPPLRWHPSSFFLFSFSLSFYPFCCKLLAIIPDPLYVPIFTHIPPLFGMLLCLRHLCVVVVVVVVVVVAIMHHVGKSHVLRNVAY